MGFINPPPEGSNELRNPDLFEHRLRYKNASFIYPIDAVPLDMIYEKPYYGKVDIHGNAVYPSEADMVQIPGNGLLLVHDFVAAAFTDLQKYIHTIIVSKDPYFRDLMSDFSPKAARRNFHKLYQDHFVGNIYNTFANDYVLRSPRVNRKIKKFDDFVEEFVKFSKLMSDQFAITKTGYIMSTDCPNSISGLIIDLQEGPCDKDALKYENFISKTSFEHYIQIVSGYGFFIDKNVPWRIAANLGHKTMEKYMTAFGTSIKNNSVFEDYFYKAEYYSYEDFKTRMWNGYQMLLLDPDTSNWGTEYKVRNCIKALWNDVGNNVYKTIYKESSRDIISTDYDKQFQMNFPNSFFLPHYFKIRVAESKLGYSNRKINLWTKKILAANDTYGIYKAVDIIEDLTKQSRVYTGTKNPGSPQKIKYFGKSTNSGLYSYMGSDNMIKSTNWQKAMAWQKEGFVGEE